jgi:hypothetical protein
MLDICEKWKQINNYSHGTSLEYITIVLKIKEPVPKNLRTNQQ